MSTTAKGRNNNKKNVEFETVLQSKREALKARLAARLGEVSIETEPDDDAGLATNSFATDLAVSTLERERRELHEVELALERMRNGEYGICAICENPIRDVRLRALPWARLCIQCANRGVDMAAD
jgi:DnaK suppressor protein